MDKEIMVQTYNGMLFKHKKEYNSDNATTWFRLEYIMPSEVRHKRTNTVQCHIYEVHEIVPLIETN